MQLSAKFGQIIGWRPPPTDRLRNPGSGAAISRTKNSRLLFSFRDWVFLLCLKQWHNWVFSKYFHWIRRIQWLKIFVIRRARPATSCVRDQNATTVPAMWKAGSLRLLQFMLQSFIRFPEFTEFTFHLRKTPIWRHLIRETWCQEQL